MHEHWTKHLPESGKLMIRLGDEQEARLQKIARLQADIKQLRRELVDNEKSIEREALTDWTPDEIAQAKELARTYKSRQAYIDEVNRIYNELNK